MRVVFFYPGSFEKIPGNSVIMTILESENFKICRNFKKNKSSKNFENSKKYEKLKKNGEFKKI